MEAIPWTLELLERGVGMMTPAEGTTAARRAISQGSALTRKRARARARDDSKVNVATVKKHVIPHESARKAKDEESQKGKGGFKGKGKVSWATGI